MITRRLKRLTIALLLPLLVLRGMLPAGYMPVGDAAGLRIVMCSAGLAALPGATDPDPSQHELPPNAGECAFAQHASTTPPEPALQQSSPVWMTVRLRPDSLAFFAPSDRPRAHPARGPPAAA